MAVNLREHAVVNRQANQLAQRGAAGARHRERDLTNASGINYAGASTIPTLLQNRGGDPRAQPFHFGHQREYIFECGANYQVVVDLWPGPTAMYRVKRRLRTGPDGGKFFGSHASILAAGSGNWRLALRAVMLGRERRQMWDAAEVPGQRRRAVSAQRKRRQFVVPLNDQPVEPAGFLARFPSALIASHQFCHVPILAAGRAA